MSKRIARELEELSFNYMLEQNKVNREAFLPLLANKYYIEFRERQKELILISKDLEGSSVLFEAMERLEKGANDLESDPEAVLQVLHDCGENSFEDALRVLRLAFNQSGDVEAMLDLEHLNGLAQDIGLQTYGTSAMTSDTAISILRACPLSFPFSGGYNASVSQRLSDAPVPMISLFQSVPDSLFYVSRLSVALGTEGDQSDLDYVSVCESPARLTQGTSECRDTISAFATGNDFFGSPGEYTVNPVQAGIASGLLVGGMCFVWFHEFAHILLPNDREHDVIELRCDEFATRAIISTGHELFVAGAFLTLSLMSCVLCTSAHEDGVDLPLPTERIKQFAKLIGASRTSLDLKKFHKVAQFAYIPLRIVEEEVFYMSLVELAQTMENSLAESFRKFGIQETQLNPIASEVVEKSFTLPPPDSDYLTLIQSEEGFPKRVTHFNALAALGFLASTVGGIAGAGNPFIAACAVVSAVASLKSIASDTSKAEGILLWTLYELNSAHRANREMLEAGFEDVSKTVEAVEVADFAPAIQGLIDKGLIKEDSGEYEVNDQIIILY